MRMSAPSAFAFSRLAPFDAGTRIMSRVGAQRDARPPGEPDGVVDAPDRKHADRATRTVDHAQIGGQQVLDAIAREGVCMAAAELHEGIGAVGPDLGRDGGGDGAGEHAVAVFVDVFHAGASATAHSATASASNASVRSASAASIFASA